MKKIMNGLMAVGFIAALLAAMAFAVLHPQTENLYENRPAVRLPAYSFSAAYSGVYQDTLESALHDQLPAAQVVEKTYQEHMNALILNALFAQSAENPNVYYQFNNLLLFHGDIVYPPANPQAYLGELSAKAENLNNLFTAHPELSFYVYYIEKDTDFNFQTGTPTGVSDTMMSMLWLPEDHKGIFRISGFDDFRNRFFRTDHHWNRIGSYDGYLQLLELLGKSDPLQPVGTKHLGDDFCGAKAIASGASSYFSEPFDAYEFNFPAMDCSVNGKPGGYGRQDLKWDDEEFGTVSYGGYYGFDCGEAAFHTGNVGAGNILVLGESFDNAIVALLATHFENLYSVDLRAYEEDMGEPFRFSEYVETHDIDTVLFIGNIDYFLLPSFNVEG